MNLEMETERRQEPKRQYDQDEATSRAIVNSGSVSTVPISLSTPPEGVILSPARSNAAFALAALGVGSVFPNSAASSGGVVVGDAPTRAGKRAPSSSLGPRSSSSGSGGAMANKQARPSRERKVPAHLDDFNDPNGSNQGGAKLSGAAADGHAPDWGVWVDGGSGNGGGYDGSGYCGGGGDSAAAPVSAVYSSDFPAASASAAAAAAAADAAAAAVDYNRRDKSLGLLCSNFVTLHGAHPQGVVELSLDSCAAELKVERRRIYDIVNILESLEFVQRVRKNTYLYEGANHLLATLKRLQTEAAELWPEDARAHGLTSSSSSSSDSPAAAGAGGAGLPSPDLDSSSSSSSSVLSTPSSSFVSSTVSSRSSKSRADTGKASGSASAAAASNAKGKSLGFLCVRFLQLFLVGFDVVSLADARDRIIYGGLQNGGGGFGNAAQPTEKESKENKTKVRRLYDIANVLLSLGLIVKHSPSSPTSLSSASSSSAGASSSSSSSGSNSGVRYKPSFRWASASPISILRDPGDGSVALASQAPHSAAAAETSIAAALPRTRNSSGGGGGGGSSAGLGGGGGGSAKQQRCPHQTSLLNLQQPSPSYPPPVRSASHSSTNAKSSHSATSTPSSSSSSSGLSSSFSVLSSAASAVERHLSTSSLRGSTGGAEGDLFGIGEEEEDYDDNMEDSGEGDDRLLGQQQQQQKKQRDMDHADDGDVAKTTGGDGGKQQGGASFYPLSSLSSSRDSPALSAASGQTAALSVTSSPASSRQMSSQQSSNLSLSPLLSLSQEDSAPASSSSSSSASSYLELCDKLSEQTATGQRKPLPLPAGLGGGGAPSSSSSSGSASSMGGSSSNSSNSNSNSSSVLPPSLVTLEQMTSPVPNPKSASSTWSTAAASLVAPPEASTSSSSAASLVSMWFERENGDAALRLPPDEMLAYQVERLRQFMCEYQDRWEQHARSEQRELQLRQHEQHLQDQERKAPGAASAAPTGAATTAASSSSSRAISLIPGEEVTQAAAAAEAAERDARLRAFSPMTCLVAQAASRADNRTPLAGEGSAGGSSPLGFNAAAPTGGAKGEITSVPLPFAASTTGLVRSTSSATIASESRGFIGRDLDCE